MAARTMPHNIDAERSVVGACIISSDALSKVIDIVSPEDFYDSKTREIYSTIVSMFRAGRSVDELTVADELRSEKKLEAIGGAGYIADLTGEVPSTINAPEYAEIVLEKSSLRKLIQAAEEIRAMGLDGKARADEILDTAESNIFSIAKQHQNRDYQPINDVLMKDLELIDEASKHTGTVTGLTTGFRDLDRATAGLQKSDLIIVAARPSMGKTAFALNIAENAALKAGASVLIFSMEMSAEQLGMRLLSTTGNVEMEKLKRGSTMTADDWNNLRGAIDRLHSTKISIDDTPNPSIFEIRNKCRRKQSEEGLDLVVIDYLQLMGDSSSDNRQQEISNLSRGMKLLAREMECPVIVLSQLSRAPELRKDRRPILSDLRESGSIEQDADIVIFLYRDEYYNEDTENPGVCEINIAKHRSGATGKIDLAWVERYTKFADRQYE
ncbi:MAG: replicative DNA helicase [Anaerovoracaceae bacterium]|jgi:replicative DNA helicase